MEPIWQAYNKLMHVDKRWCVNEKQRTLLEMVKWYTAHRPGMLAHHNQFLVAVNSERLPRMGRKTQKR